MRFATPPPSGRRANGLVKSVKSGICWWAQMSQCIAHWNAIQGTGTRRQGFFVKCNTIASASVVWINCSANSLTDPLASRSTDLCVWGWVGGLLTVRCKNPTVTLLHCNTLVRHAPEVRQNVAA